MGLFVGLFRTLDLTGFEFFNKMHNEYTVYFHGSEGRILKKLSYDD